jgi:hypothetical protein
MFERSLAPQSSVGHAIERNATRHDQIRRSSPGVGFPRHAQHDLFSDLLDACGQIHVALLKQGFGRAGPTTK